MLNLCHMTENPALRADVNSLLKSIQSDYDNEMVQIQNKK